MEGDYLLRRMNQARDYTQSLQRIHRRISLEMSHFFASPGKLLLEGRKYAERSL